MLVFDGSHESGLFLSLLLLCLAWSRSEIVVDDCSSVHGPENRIDSLRVASENLVVDTEAAENYDGDQGRFKRANAAPGILSYVSQRGFEGIEVDGYVFGTLPRGSWALNITVGDVDSTEESVLLLRRNNLEEYTTKGGAGNWKRFSIRLWLRRKCPSRVTITLDGSATNNEYSGWGLQLSEVQLVQSLFEECTPTCSFNRSECPASPGRQVIDAADHFRNVYSISYNMKMDDSNPGKYFNGDGGRFIRSNNKEGDVVYKAAGGIRSLDVEIYQYSPYNTQMTVLPYDSDECQPIVLEPVYARMTQKSSEGWMHRIARFDLSSLPLCPTHVAIRISGGKDGWELQIAHVTLNVVGQLESNELSTLSVQQESSDGDDDNGFGSTWWMWLCGLLGIIVVSLFAARMIQGMAQGNDDDSVHHVSFLRRLLTGKGLTSEEDIADTDPRTPTDEDFPDIYSTCTDEENPEMLTPVMATEPSFTFSPIKIRSP